MPYVRRYTHDGKVVLDNVDDPKYAKGGNFVNPPNNSPPYNGPMSEEDYLNQFERLPRRALMPDTFAIFAYHSVKNPPRVEKFEIIPICYNFKEEGKINYYSQICNYTVESTKIPRLNPGLKLVMQLPDSDATAAIAKDFQNAICMPLEQCSEVVQNFSKNCSQLCRDSLDAKSNNPNYMVSFLGMYGASRDFFNIIAGYSGGADSSFRASIEYLRDSVPYEHANALAIRAFCENGNDVWPRFIEDKIRFTRNERAKDQGKTA